MECSGDSDSFCHSEGSGSTGTCCPLAGSNRGEVGPPRGHAQLGHISGSPPKGQWKVLLSPLSPGPDMWQLQAPKIPGEVVSSGKMACVGKHHHQESYRTEKTLGVVLFI